MFRRDPFEERLCLDLHERTLSKAEVLHAVRGALDRSAAAVHQEMQRGVNGLATIASSAPLRLLMAAVLGILGAYKESARRKRS